MDDESGEFMERAELVCVGRSRVRDGETVGGSQSASFQRGSGQSHSGMQRIVRGPAESILIFQKCK